MTHRLRIVVSFVLVVAGACEGALQKEPLAENVADMTVCADGPTLKGIDVSFYQETINWTSVKNDGVVFAFIRVSDGLNYPDSKFAANWAGAKQAGVLRGAYQFFHPGQDPIAQADLLLSKMGPLGPTDLPPVIDVEATDGLSPATITTKIGQWIDRVETATGRKPIIYSGKYFWQDNVKSTAFAAYPLWIPQYGPTCPDLQSQWSDWAFFQYTDSGKVAGVPGNVDMNLYNGDLAQLMALSGAPKCGDGLCNGDETATSCTADCPVCAPVPASGRIIEEDDVCTTLGGTVAALRRESAGHGGSLRWTHTTDWDSEDNFATWSFDFVAAGRYRVEIATPAPWAEATQAKYVVRHGLVEESVIVDQSAVDGWTLVGEFDFAQGQDQWLHVGDNTGEPLAGKVQLVFDAVRLTRIAPDPPGDDPNDPNDPNDPADPSDPTDPSGGCQLGLGSGGGGARGWLVFGLGLALVTFGQKRRRYTRRHAGLDS
jgi:lysozyme